MREFTRVPRGVGWSDHITGKNTPSKIVPYEQAIERCSLPYVQAAVRMDFGMLDDFITGLSYFYRKPRVQVEFDLCNACEKHLQRLQRRLAESGIDVGTLELPRLR